MSLRSWATDRFARDLADHWPMTEGGLLGMRSPSGGIRPSGERLAGALVRPWLVRDCLLTDYVWDQEIATDPRSNPSRQIRDSQPLRRLPARTRHTSTHRRE